MSEPGTHPTQMDLYQWWWLHDARWYQEVAKRYGFDAANELNRTALQFVAIRVGRSVAKTLPRPTAELEWSEAVAAFGRCSRSMWPEESSKFTCVPTGPGEFETNVTYNFALVMLQRAGTLDKYDCPCLALRRGWFTGLGLDAVDDQVVQCMRTGGSACTYRSKVKGFLPETSSAP